MDLLANLFGEKWGPVFWGVSLPRGNGWEEDGVGAPKACRVPADALPMTSVSPETRTERQPWGGVPCSQALAPLPVQCGDSTCCPQRAAAKEAQPPPWPRGLTKAGLAQGSVHVPQVPHHGGLPRLAFSPRLGLSPAPPFLGPFLEGQGVRSEGPSPRAPTSHPRVQSPHLAPSLQCRLRVRKATRGDERQGA